MGCAIHFGLPILVVLFFLAVPARETRASSIGLTGAIPCYALHIPILCYQHTFEGVKNHFWRTTALSLVTAVVLLHLRLPACVLRASGQSGQAQGSGPCSARDPSRPSSHT